MVHDHKFSTPATGRTAASPFDWVDETYMSHALQLAWQAAGRTRPNPLVGAVIVKNGVVVGEGYHHRCGDAHAEVEALDRAGDRARGATMYVSLEPCAHQGRTPPCVDRLIASGIERIVIPALDPDEHVHGRGVAALRAAGIQVEVGCAETAAIATNIGYYKQRLQLGPTVVLKMALSMDGRIASRPGRRDKITGEASHLYVHRLRANSDGIVVGIDTVRTDDPILDCRLVDCGVPPVPVVFDGDFELPADNRWSRQNRSYVVVGSDSDTGLEAATERHRARGGRILPCACDDEGRVDVARAVRVLDGAGIRRLLVEGGAQVFTSFVGSGLWDAMFLFYSPNAFGKEGVPVYAETRALTPDAVPVDAVRLESDFLHRYLNRRIYEEIVSRLEKG
jgi:diaminohydroxyphosphoribosylaminopyrimidine deaminase/5-amino-6-(5-phosphoribosylamino)uracil reductase